MNTLYMVIAAALTLGAAYYAQRQIPRFTAGARNVLLTRALLLVLGVAFGGVAAWTFAQTEGFSILPFLIGFGAVHVPAAFILFFKRESGTGKS